MTPSVTERGLKCPTCGCGLVLRASPLTKRQVEILRFIWDSVGGRGFAPTFTEIAEHFGYRTLATVHEHLENMERKGAICRSYNEPRGITVLVSPEDLGLATLVSP